MATVAANPESGTRDALFRDEASSQAGDARLCIAVAGIDRYKRAEPLRNAVNDARGVLDAFEQLGFQRIAEPLYDDHATRAALFGMVEDLKSKLRRDDSLVLFFAGHGRDKSDPVDNGPPVRKGYLI